MLREDVVVLMREEVVVLFFASSLFAGGFAPPVVGFLLSISAVAMLLFLHPSNCHSARCGFDGEVHSICFAVHVMSLVSSDARVACTMECREWWMECVVVVGWVRGAQQTTFQSSMFRRSDRSKLSDLPLDRPCSGPEDPAVPRPAFRSNRCSVLEAVPSFPRLLPIHFDSVESMDSCLLTEEQHSDIADNDLSWRDFVC